MSVGPVARGLAGLLGGLGGLGGVGPQGPGPAARPPVDGIPALPSRPSFQDRYQQDTFEQSGQGRGSSGRGPNLTGGDPQGSSSFSANGGGAGTQARASEDNTAELIKDAERRRLKFKPVDVMEFPKGGSPRLREQPGEEDAQAQGEPRQDARPDPQAQQQPQDPKGKKKPGKKPAQKPAKPIVRRPIQPLMAARPSQAKPVDAGATFKPMSAAAGSMAQARGSSGGMEFRPAAERRMDAPVSARDSGPAMDRDANPGLSQSPLPSLFDKHEIGNKAESDARTAKMMVQLAQRI